MPHLKVSIFDTSIIEECVKSSKVMTFVASAYGSEDIIIGIFHQDEEFLLQLKPSKDSYLLKYDKVTRPLRVNILKDALDIVSRELGLERLNSNIAISTTKKSIDSKYLKKIEDFDNITYPKDKVSVEVGFGSGRHILYQAISNPDTLFIGIEIHTPSAGQLLKQIELQNIENIWVLNYDARLFLEMLPSNRCDKIFVHFPVPWDKKPHRRVISSSFLSESMRVLGVGGRLELRTDSDRYFWYSLETFFAPTKIEVEVRKNEALGVTSKYEARWLRQEKDIYDVYVKSTLNSPQKDESREFNFDSVKYSLGLEDRLPKKALVFDDYFLHFEKVYIISKSSILIKCAFGSFDRPEHKYILLDENKCRYFVSTPVKTSVNFKAHERLIEEII